MQKEGNSAIFSSLRFTKLPQIWDKMQGLAWQPVKTEIKQDKDKTKAKFSGQLRVQSFQNISTWNVL